MITSRNPPRYRKLLALALALSIIIHFFGGYFLTRFVRYMGEIADRGRAGEPPKTSDIITIEREKPKPPAPTAPPAVAKTEPVVPVIPQLPRPKVIAPPPAAAPHQRVARSLPKTHHEVAHIVVHAPRQEAKSRGEGRPETSQLSGEQIAQIESKFSKTIADSRTDIKTVTDQVQDSQPTTKHYSTQFNGIHSDLQRGQGYIHPITLGQVRGGYVYYYTHYEYMYADGHVEQDDIPWPYVYPVNHDLFAMHVHEIPMQGPPPDFKLTRQLQPLMMQFFGGPHVE